MSNSLAEYIEHANAAMKLQDWTEAIKRWQAILVEFNDESPPETFQKLSVAFRKTGNLDEAQAIITKGLKTFPDSIDVLIEQAEIATVRQQWVAASELWLSITEKFGQDVPEKAWIKLIRILKHMSELQAAGRAASRSLKAYPDSPQLRLEAAKLASIREDWQQAAMLWRSAADVWGDTVTVDDYVNYAESLRKAGKTKESEEIILRALKKYPDERKLNVVLAEIVTDRKDWIRALTLWREILERHESVLGTATKQLARFNISILNRLVKPDNYKRLISEYNKSRTKKPKKIVVVTAVTKGYDTLKPPEVIDNRFDYVAYCDSEIDGMGIYEVRSLPEPARDGGRAIRYVKTHPHVLFKNYDIVVWVDTSIMIVGDIFPLIEKFVSSGLPIGSGVHPNRKSVYEEFQACIDLKKDDYATLKRQLDFYKSIGFDNDDLAENGLLMFNLQKAKVALAMEDWWDQICTFSSRDQLSFNYALSKNKAEWFRLTRLPQEIRNHPDFVIMPHHSEQRVLEELRKIL